MSARYLESASLPTPSVVRTSATTRWTGRILTGLAALFLAMDAGMKILGARQAVDGTVQLGFAPHMVPTIGLLALACLVLYIIPRTAPVGAVLCTGYLGGAVAASLRLGSPLFTNTLFPVYFAALVWGGLYLRDDRVRALLRPAR